MIRRRYEIGELKIIIDFFSLREVKTETFLGWMSINQERVDEAMMKISKDFCCGHGPEWHFENVCRGCSADATHKYFTNKVVDENGIQQNKEN